MGRPVVGLSHRRQALGPPGIPRGARGSGPFKAPAQLAAQGHIHQQTVATALQDVHRTAVVGGHHRQPAGGRLQQGEPKGFREGRVHKQTAAPGHPTQQGWHLGPAVLLGIGHLAIKIVAINGLKQQLPFLPLFLAQQLQILAAAQHQHEVVVLPKEIATAKGRHQGGNIFTAIQATKGQQAGALGFAQERGHQGADFGILTGNAMGMELP